MQRNWTNLKLRTTLTILIGVVCTILVIAASAKDVERGREIAQVLEGDNAVAKHREIMGATDPKKAAAYKGKISAYDKDTMQELWSFDTGTQFAGNPMTYSVNGKQYVALTLGGRPGRDEGSFPEATAIAQNVMLVVFGL